MNTLPAILTPSGEEELLLSSGTIMRVPKTTPQFSAWSGPIPFDRYGGKAILDFHGEALFAELMILRLFEEEGWSGVWVDTYRHCFRRNPATKVEIPKERLRTFEQLQEAAGTKSGCFDVYVWKDEMTVFAESKCTGHDKMRSTQIRWLEAALRFGLPIESFLIVEWSPKEEPNTTSAADGGIPSLLHAERTWPAATDPQSWPD